MQTARLALGWIALGVGAGIILIGYGSVPDAATCAAVQHQISQSCTTTPAAGYFVAAGLLAAAGILLLIWHHAQGRQAR